MPKHTIPETVTTTPVEDAKRLREWLVDLEISQAEFAEKYGVGSQSQYWAFLNPENKRGRPLNLMAAIGFARGINALKGPCCVGDFSPYLQGVVDKIAEFESKSSRLNKNFGAFDDLERIRPILITLSQLNDERLAEVEKYANERLNLQRAETNYSTQRAG